MRAIAAWRDPTSSSSTRRGIIARYLRHHLHVRRAAMEQQKQPRGGAEREGTGTTQRQGTERQTGAETTGRGDASLTTEQRTKIRSVVVSKNIEKVTNVNFSISVGARVPRRVRFHPIPVEIVEIHPAWRGYQVILVGEELIVVHPSTLEIVAVIAV
jgi:hypothetical protein